MTEEEIKALQDAKEAAEKLAADTHAILLQERAEKERAQTGLNNLVEELKTERLKKNEALGKVDLSKNEVDVKVLIEQAFAERENTVRKSSYEEALSEFKSSKQEFQADAAGIVFSKFQDGLKRFNFADIGSKEQMKSRLEEVYRFMNFKPNEESSPEYDGAPANPYPTKDTPTQMPNDIKEVLKESGMDEAKYNSLRTKYPEALSGLGM